MSKKLIVVIDDEKDILDLLSYNLQKEGYGVFGAKTGEEGFDLIKSKKPDLVLLDLMLPGMDGLEVCRLIQADASLKHIPILMLTAKNTDIDQIVGLEVGATDYVPKPFSVKVLLARVKNILRRSTAKAQTGTVLKFGDILLDKDKQLFSIKGKAISLTALEFRIMSYLMEHPGKVFSRDALLSGAWSGEAFVVDRTVDVHVKSIRQKMGKHREVIQTVRGTGYRFSEEL